MASLLHPLDMNQYRSPVDSRMTEPALLSAAVAVILVMSHASISISISMS